VARARESGQGRLGVVIGLGLIGCTTFLGVKFIPVRVAAYEFRDYVEQECRYAAVRQDDQAVAKRILDKAKELEIPLKAKDLKLQRTAEEMIITASYSKPIDLKFTTYDYTFEVKQRAPLF
jgi:hypothetical protein